VAVIIRESWGWQTADKQVHLWTRPLPTRQFARATGLTSDHLRCDIDKLIARSVLMRDGERYCFVADSRLWKSPERSPHNRRIRPSKPSAVAAETALPNLASKIDHRKQRNVAAASGSDLFTGGENSPSRSSRSRPEPPRATAEISATVAGRLVAVIVAFVGPLTPSQLATLRHWIASSGVADVWAALEPTFRRGRVAARRQLESALGRHAGEL